ncbi:Fic family protein [Corynebacterium sp. ED61]|uniref:Fic family protein n=1 Tax=Corynebacterium TaxID=1716 RepID=UPI001883BCD7|nr:Fic family protein [Corynebacterium sp. ED61]MBF0581500.1 Fic family protein [Corynebacterium sp. ED61]
MRRRDVLILVQAAIVHAHSETIHPLADGNGRTDRALVHVLLRGRGLTTITALPTSPGGISKPIFESWRLTGAGSRSGL